MKKNKFKKISHKTMLIAGLSVIALGAVGTAYGLQSRQSDEKPTVAQSISNDTDNTIPTAPTQSAGTPTTANPVSPTPNPGPEPTPTPPANPYQEGFNLWHVYNRRIAVGKQMPKDTPNEQTACSAISQKSGYTTSKTPSQYAIACLPTTLGFVEKVNDDGSFVVSFTNYGQGWNKYMEVTEPAANANKYRLFIQ